MLLLVVWIVVAIVVVGVLGGVAYNVLGSVGRLRREVAALDAEVRPVIGSVQETVARAEAARAQRG